MALVISAAKLPIDTGNIILLIALLIQDTFFSLSSPGIQGYSANPGMMKWVGVQGS